MIKFSIIVPVFNRQSSIGKCIESIQNQDYSNYECILIDDGSTDHSLQICKKYAENDKRFLVLHKENGGVSSARNMALDRVHGIWLCFVDSDDTIKPNHLSSLLKRDKDGVDIVFCGYQDTYIDKVITHSYNDIVYIGKNSIRDFLRDTDVLWHMIPWDRMFRADIIKKNHICFNEKLSISEDRLFCYNYLVHTRGIATISDVTYVHDSTDSNSLSHRSVPIDMQKNRYRLMAKATKKIIAVFNMNKKDSVMLHSYNEGLLILMQKTTDCWWIVLTIIGCDAFGIVKLITKQILHRVLLRKEYP